ncbi:MAG: hypothetical protein VB064_09515 [Oscillospiraceae bacterium]|nr:hypothetical protein [Oscillospiraceae bacterium]
MEMEDLLFRKTEGYIFFRWCYVFRRAVWPEASPARSLDLILSLMIILARRPLHLKAWLVHFLIFQGFIWLRFYSVLRLSDLLCCQL